MSKDSGRLREPWKDELSGEDEDRPYRRRQYDEDEVFHEHRGRRRKRRIWPWMLVGCAGGIFIIVLLVLAGVFAVAGNVPVPIGGIGKTAAYTSRSQQIVSSSSIGQLEVHNEVGDIAIMVDPGARTPIVTSIKKVMATSAGEAKKEFGRISVQVQPPSPPGNTLTVDVTLPTPNNSILDKNSDAVDVSIALPPQVINNGATQLVLSADTSVGNVLVSGLSGVLIVKDSIGNVTVHNATLADGSHLATGTGNVVFDGTLNTTSANPQPRYKLQSEKGDVTVTLPATTNVILDANVNIGRIESDFPITIASTGGSPSYYGPLTSSTVAPNAVLTLDISTGDIHLHKA